jgi:hypothetical protein
LFYGEAAEFVSIGLSITRSRPELPQVVVQMFIHSAAPSLRGELSKEWMGMPSAFCFAALEKLTQLYLELFLLVKKIALVSYDQLLVGGAVFGERLLIGEHGLDKWAQQSADKNARQIEAPGGHVDARRTMRHHLRDIHFAPLPLGRRLERIDSSDHFVDVFSLEQVLQMRPPPQGSVVSSIAEHDNAGFPFEQKRNDQ